MYVVITILAYLISIYEFLIFIRVLLSWVNVNPNNRVIDILYRITEPVLRPLRRVIPPIGGALDLSPVVAMILLEILRRVIFTLA